MMPWFWMRMFHMAFGVAVADEHVFVHVTVPLVIAVTMIKYNTVQCDRWILS